MDLDKVKNVYMIWSILNKGILMQFNTKPPVYVLSVVNKNSLSTFPKSGYIEAKKFSKDPECNTDGFHGFLWGCGNNEIVDWSDDAIWSVISVPDDDNLIMLQNCNNFKFKSGEVIFSGNQKEATNFLLKHPYASDKPVIGCYKSGGLYSVLSGGDKATLCGGIESILIWKVYFAGCYHIITAFVDGRNILPNVAYTCKNFTVVPA